MRVLFLATRDWYNPGAAGGDIVMWEYARYLAFRGHPVTFVTSSFPGARAEEQVDGINVVRLGGIASLWLRTFLYYIKQCRGEYDVVVAEGFGGSRIPRLAPLYVQEPVVTEWHQLHHELFVHQYPRIFVPFLDLLEQLTAFVHRKTLVRAGTVEWQEAFLRLGFRRQNVFVVPVSIREEWLGGRRDMSPGPPSVVWLGKFRRYKCVHHVIQAMRAVVEKVPEATLYLVGRRDDLRYEESLRRLVEGLSMTESVQFLVNVSEDEKRSILGNARLLVLPSPVEGFGIVVLEANASGVPVVASDGVPEGAVRHGRNGLRYPFGDISALTENIIRVLTDDALHAKLSSHARVFAQLFGWRRVGEQFEAMLAGTIFEAEQKTRAKQAGDISNAAG